MDIRERIARSIFKDYVSSFTLTVPPIDEGDGYRNSLIEGAKQYKTGLVKMVHDRIVKMILDDCLRQLGFKAKDTKELLYWRGIARGVQLYEEHLNLYNSLSKTKDILNNESTD